ncbi:WXG100 family type VII secretion target [Actinoplanes sp. M2I2]|uniref:WXG100 family type VII secretion target n=1 Tax=Actinoplanes sp. M2I2 TaxID=1734444 RepID=UPI002021A54C|nr:hypothetical protein [Actinoplanes sp. M2I2]
MIETRLDGDPGSIRASADWLKVQLAARLDRSVTDMFAARDDAGSGWQGDAGPGFADRMDTAGRKSDKLRADVETAAQGLHRYADDLTTAQAGMERARAIAREGGLQLAGTTILDPGPAPAVVTLPTDGVPTPQMVTAHNDSVAALNDHQAKANAYLLAKQEADRSNGIKAAAQAIAKNMVDDVKSKPVLLFGDFVNGTAGAALGAHTSVLKKHHAGLMDDVKRLEQHYLKTPGGTKASKELIEAGYKRFQDADDVARRTSSLTRRVGSKLPVIGAGLTVAGIGYDIHNGKPPGKAIISGAGGMGASIVAGMAIGAAGGPIGIVGGALVGTAAGLVASGALDWGYDQLPDGAKKAIEDGVAEVGNAVGDAGEAVGDSAKKVWNSIF